MGSYIQAIWMFIIMGAWISDLTILGWVMWFINLVVWIVMLLFILLDGLVQIASGDSMPSILTPLIGLILDLAFQIIYATTYGYSRTLMKCWGYTFPELGDCVF